MEEANVNTGGFLAGLLSFERDFIVWPCGQWEVEIALKYLVHCFDE